ncbi:MAG: YkgJ family cysteine cluster protein [Candidatus Omnitrophica bacterium]|nr:YkgJ family cysteine cluster protein [Candidatus Omnitrophota bacterium]
MEKNNDKHSHKDCVGCPAICCYNLAMHIGKPVTKQEIEDLKWQLQFDTVKVYIRHNKWHQLVEGKCMYLDTKNRCSIYDKRMDKCKTHNPPHCERYGKFYDIMFNFPEDLDKYLLKRKKNKLKKTIKR